MHKRKSVKKMLTKDNLYIESLCVYVIVLIHKGGYVHGTFLLNLVIAWENHESHFVKGIGLVI